MSIAITLALLAGNVHAQDRPQADASAPSEAASAAAEKIEEAAESTQKAVEATVEAAEAADAADEATTAAAEVTEEAQKAVEAAEASGAVVEGADAINWSGSWRSFWRGGQAVVTLEQNGTEISGEYQPGDGAMTGTVEGSVFTGTWMQAGSEGGFEFAMAPDGQSFVGRSGNGEYWNGARLEEGATDAARFGSASPKDTLLSLMAAMNAAANGDSLAELEIRRHVAFPDGEEDVRARNGRIIEFLRLLDLSTFRAMEVPETGENSAASFEVGPAGAEWTFPIEFTETSRDQWSVVVPTEETLDTITAEALEALEVADFDELAEVRKFSPRQAGRDFLRGTATWDDGGDELALSTLDMSEIPEKLQSTDGPLAAEYIRQIIDRAGYSILQEVPNDPDRRQPFVVYEHALGDIDVDRYPQEDGGVRWLFTADSLARAPDIYEAMQNLPLADGVAPSEPLTRAFKLRSQLKSISPRLLKRPFILENWQWLAIAGILLVTVVSSWVLVWLGRLLSVGVLRLGKATPRTRTALASAFEWPGRVFAAGAVLTVLLREIGLRPDISAIGNGFAALFMLLGGTFFIYRLVDAATIWLADNAAKTQTQIDDIAVGLGGGLAKIAVLVGGVILAADVLGLPYEGVIAGLGVGGLAFAIAAKDAVGNFIGAGILMSDRSFKKGDMIEGGGLKGIVEDVGLRSTRLRTMDGAVVVVPNAKLSDGNVNNWGPPSAAGPEALETSVSLAIDTPRPDVDAFVDRLRAVLAAEPNARPDVSVGLSGIGRSSLDIDVTGAFEPGTDMVAAKHRLMGDIVDLAREMGIEFALEQTLNRAGAARTEAA